MGARYDFPIPFGWYAVSLSRELAVGEVRPLKYFGTDLVLFRTESGEAKLLDAFCPHLGAHLGHGGKVKGEHIACPFHAWEFSGEGVCKHIPYAKAIPPRADGKQTVHAYPTVERNQVVWAWYHPARIAPTFEVEHVPEVQRGVDRLPRLRVDHQHHHPGGGGERRRRRALPLRAQPARHPPWRGQARGTSPLRALRGSHQQAGGKILVSPFDIQIGRCVVIADPWGNRLVLLDGSKGMLQTDADGNVTGNIKP